MGEGGACLPVLTAPCPKRVKRRGPKDFLEASKVAFRFCGDVRCLVVRFGRYCMGQLPVLLPHLPGGVLTWKNYLDSVETRV